MAILRALAWLLIPVFLVVGYAFIAGGTRVRRYLVVRLLTVIPVMILMGTTVFIIMRVVPGDPLAQDMAQYGSPELRERVRTELGLNDPLVVQYGRFLKGVFTLDFGQSVTGVRRNVTQELSERIPATAELVVPAGIVTIVLGIALGTSAAMKRGRPRDHGLRLYSVLSQSVPSFFIALVLQLVVGLRLGWAPIAGRVDESLLQRAGVGSGGYLLFRSIINGDWTIAASALNHLILPATAIVWIVVGSNMRITRINMIEALHSDYILAGMARGLKDRVLKYRYAFRNALLPVVTFLGLQMAILLGGTVVIEQVFSWPGLGKYTLDRILARDYPAIEGAIVMITLFVVLISLVVDSLYSLIDSRVEL
jgi:peptide/nickel transport system permease protein